LKPSGLEEVQKKSAGAKLTIHACEVGQSKEALRLWGRFFGGKNIDVTAPKIFIHFFKGDEEGKFTLSLDKDLKKGGLMPLGSKEANKHIEHVVVDDKPLGSERPKDKSDAAKKRESYDPPMSPLPDPEIRLP
jgi:hypothetical protein